MLETNTIYCGDCLDLIPQLDDRTIDLVVTSPPYNVDLGNNKYHKSPYDLYNDNKEHKEYISFLEEVFRRIYPKMKTGGRVCINIGDGCNGAIPTASDISQCMRGLTYIPTTHIVWEKGQCGARTAWGSFMSPSCPSFPTPFEHILVFCKENNKLQEKGETDLTKQEFIDWSLALWRFLPETKQTEIGHNAMFPVELPTRCIKMLSYVGALVLDPFSGAGTTALAAKMLKRNYIGFELSETYCGIARKRIREMQIDVLDKIIEYC